MNLWQKVPRRTPQTAIAKAVDCSLQPSGKALLLKTALIYVIEHKEIKLVPE